jgi:tRNA dimethylallyltransferase
MGGKIGAVLIAGPTASGKSALALDIARERNGVVINADSMQVYRDLRILTARPTTEEEAEAPHRLYGNIDGAVNYSVGHYLRDAAAALAEAGTVGRLPILVGGTGLYFKALLEGLSEVPPVPVEIREQVRRASENQASETLHAELARRDPDTARRLRPGDRLRVLRALEVLEATSRPLVSFQGRKQPGPLADATTLRVFLNPDREALRTRIDRRFEAMIAHGTLDEARALAARRLDPMLPVMRAHGVPGLLAHLRGEISLEEAVARGQGDTRRYAKRQFTWFRHQMPGWTWIAPEEARGAVLGALDQSGREGAS